jgi:hypothetical protein
VANNKKDWLGDNWCSLMATALGFMIVTQLSARSSAISLNTEALGGLRSALSSLNVTVALNSQAVISAVDGLDDLDDRVRVLEIGGGRSE